MSVELHCTDVVYLEQLELTVQLCAFFDFVRSERFAPAAFHTLRVLLLKFKHDVGIFDRTCAAETVDGDVKHTNRLQSIGLCRGLPRSFAHLSSSCDTNLFLCIQASSSPTYSSLHRSSSRTSLFLTSSSISCFVCLAQPENPFFRLRQPPWLRAVTVLFRFDAFLNGTFACPKDRLSIPVSISFFADFSAAAALRFWRPFQLQKMLFVLAIRHNCFDHVVNTDQSSVEFLAEHCDQHRQQLEWIIQ